MPIYEFECRRCAHVWDRLQKMSDPDPEACPDCGASEVGRRMTAAAFRLKGAGWYETDFKGDKDKKRNLVEGSSGTAADGKPAESAGGSDKAADSGTSEATKPTTPAASTAAAPAAVPSGGSGGSAS